MELQVLAVATVDTLLLPSVDTDRRDCGRRMADCTNCCDCALGARGMEEDVGDSDPIGRNEDGAGGGLDMRLLSLSLFLAGEGESSMMSTHPEESGADPLL